MTTKHTPGPWGFDAESGEVYYADSDVQPLIAAVSCENCDTHGQYLADGALCAAAPDLLAALQDIKAWNDADIKGFEDISPNLDMLKARRKLIRAAIAKAEGAP